MGSRTAVRSRGRIGVDSGVPVGGVPARLTGVALAGRGAGTAAVEPTPAARVSTSGGDERRLRRARALSALIGRVGSPARARASAPASPSTLAPTRASRVPLADVASWPSATSSSGARTCWGAGGSTRPIGTGSKLKSMISTEIAGRPPSSATRGCPEMIRPARHGQHRGRGRRALRDPPDCGGHVADRRLDGELRHGVRVEHGSRGGRAERQVVQAGDARRRSSGRGRMRRARPAPRPSAARPPGCRSLRSRWRPVASHCAARRCPQAAMGCSVIQAGWPPKRHPGAPGQRSRAGTGPGRHRRRRSRTCPGTPPSR